MHIDLVDSEFTAEVVGADRAVGTEVNQPGSFTRVRTTLKAGKVSTIACTGARPGAVRCASCGQDTRHLDRQPAEMRAAAQRRAADRRR